MARTPEDAAAVLLAARTYMIAGRSEYAEQLLRRVIALDPTSMDAYSDLGRLFVSLRRIDDARAEFEQLVSRAPNSVPARTMLAVILHLQGKLDDAARQYEKVVAIDIHSAAVAANNLAWLYAQGTGGGTLDRAMQLAEAAHRQLPSRPEVSDTLGWVYYKKGLLPLAIDMMQNSVKVDPSNPTYHYHLGLAYAKRGESRAARQSLQQALNLKTSFDGARHAADVLRELPN